MGKRGGISRERFFAYAFTAATVWCEYRSQWIDKQFSSSLASRFCAWISLHRTLVLLVGMLDQTPKQCVSSRVVGSRTHHVRDGFEVVLNQLFGYQSGLGMSLITLDWSQIAFIGSPLATPWWAEGNVAFGFVFFFWFITPILYYTNVWDSQYMPVISRNAFDNTGHQYNVSLILTDTMMDMEKYRDYSPLFLPTGFVISYALSFASVTGNYLFSLSYKPMLILRVSSNYGPRFPLLPQANRRTSSTVSCGTTGHSRKTHGAVSPSA